MTTMQNPAQLPREAAAVSETRRAILMMTLALWTCNFLIATASGVVKGEDDPWLRAGVRLVVDLIGMGLCGIILIGLEGRQSRPFRKRTLLAAPLALVIAAVFLLINYLAVTWSGKELPITRERIGSNVFYLGVWLWFFLCWTALYLAITYSAQVRHEAAARARIQVLERDAQLRALRYQINPHFLFNALNSVSSLVMDARNADAEVMISRLSDFLRSSLTEESGDDGELGGELKHQALYLSIEQVRFPELQFEVEVEPGLEGVRIPSLLLQPLVENAIRYDPGGVEPKTIHLRAVRLGDRLRLSIANRIATQRVQGGGGVGLVNVRERLTLHYGHDYAMAAGPTEKGQFEVCIDLPLVRS